MRDIEARILKRFRDYPGEAYTTQSIVQHVFLDEYAAIKKFLQSPNQADVLKGKRMSWKLHRRLLYHLNKLVKDNILKVDATLNKNQKTFKLVMDSGELIVKTKRSTVILHKPIGYTMPIDAYEQQGIVVNDDPNTWLSKINCVLMNAECFDNLEDMFAHLKDLMFIINDTLAIWNLPVLLNTSTKEDVEKFLSELFELIQDFDRRVNILLDSSLIKNQEIFTYVIGRLYEHKETGVILVQYVHPRQLYTRQIHKYILESSLNVKGKSYVVNKQKYSKPFIVGRSGVFTMSDKDFEVYKNNKQRAVCIAYSSLAIDIRKFREIDGSAKEFYDIVKKSVISLLQANSISRRRMEENFAFVATLLRRDYNAFFMYARNYIRFWNYDLTGEYFETFKGLLDATCDDMHRLARQEEIVFQSCGIPIRFRVAFSSSFSKFNVAFKRTYRKSKTIMSLQDFQQKDMLEQLSLRESIIKYLNGGDRIRFFRAGNTEAEVLLKELSYLLNAVDIPVVCYDFADRAENLKLQDFFGG